MGYDTRHRGTVRVNPPLNPDEREYLARFSRTRQVERPGEPYVTAAPGEAPDANVVAAGKPGFWCDWVPTVEGHLELPPGFQRLYAAPEWLVYLRDHFLSPGALARGAPGFGAFTFDHRLDGAVQAQGQIEGDRWTLVVRNSDVGVRRDHLPCPACWVDGVRAVVPPAAAYRFEHPEPAGNAEPFDVPPDQRDPATIGPPDRCRAGDYRPAVTRQPVIWPVRGDPGPLRPPWEARLAALLEPGATLEYRIDDDPACET